MTTDIKTPLNSVMVDSVFSCSWGYDQTNVDFFQVVEMTPSGKSAIVRLIDKILVIEESQSMSGKIKPNVGAFISGKVTKRIKNNSFRVNSYSNAYLLGDVTKSHYVSWCH